MDYHEFHTLRTPASEAVLRARRTSMYASFAVLALPGIASNYEIRGVKAKSVWFSLVSYHFEGKKLTI
jgi:hypothetical protein